MSLEHLPATTDVDAIVAALERDGAVIVDDVLDRATCDRLEDELAPSLAATPGGPDDFSGRNTRRFGALIARSATCRDLVMHPLALGTAGAWLAHATNFQLHVTQ